VIHITKCGFGSQRREIPASTALILARTRLSTIQATARRISLSVGGLLWKIIVLDGTRTPTGSFGGICKNVAGYELGAAASKAALERAQVNGEDIAEVITGCIGQVRADAYNARRVAVTIGLPTNVPTYTVNRLCGSRTASHLVPS